MVISGGAGGGYFLYSTDNDLAGWRTAPEMNIADQIIILES